MWQLLLQPSIIEVVNNAATDIGQESRRSEMVCLNKVRRAAGEYFPRERNERIRVALRVSLSLARLLCSFGAIGKLRTAVPNQ